MKTTGSVRRLDDLGRVVIPKSVMQSLNLKEGDMLEVHTEDEFVCFKKYEESTSRIQQQIDKYKVIIERLERRKRQLEGKEQNNAEA